MRWRDSAGEFSRLPEHDDTPSMREFRSGGARGVNGHSPAKDTAGASGGEPPATSPRIPFPRPQIKKKVTEMTAYGLTYLEQTETRMRNKRADAERERASRTIMDALDVARGTSAARDARYGYAQGRGSLSRRPNGSPVPAAISSLCFRCVSHAGVTRNLEISVKSAVLHTFRPDDVIEVFELCRTTGGQPRARTACGWVSVISQNGKRLLKQVEEDRVSARVNGPRHDDTSNMAEERIAARGIARSAAASGASALERSDRSDISGDQSHSPRGLRTADGALSASVDEDSISEAGTFDGSEYWSAEEEGLEEELQALELDETHVAARWGAGSAAEGARVGTRNSKSPTGSVDSEGVVEVSDDGQPTVDHPRITEQHMKHTHMFEWEKALAAYLSRMVSDDVMDDDFKVTLRDDADVDQPIDGMPVLEFKVDIKVPRILQWIARRQTCELLERCTIDWDKRQFTVESRTLNWTDKFSVTESSVYAAQPVDGEERTDFYKVLHIEQFMAFPPVWVVNWVRDRWALKSREGRVQVDEICSTIRFEDEVRWLSVVVVVASRPPACAPATFQLPLTSTLALGAIACWVATCAATCRWRTDEMACCCTVAQATVEKTWQGALLSDNRSKWQKEIVGIAGFYEFCCSEIRHLYFNYLESAAASLLACPLLAFAWRG